MTHEESPVKELLSSEFSASFSGPEHSHFLGKPLLRERSVWEVLAVWLREEECLWEGACLKG